MRPIVRFVEVMCVAALVAALIVLAGGCGYLSGERFTLLGCDPTLHVCRVFDTYTGTVILRPLPQLAAERGELEVKN